MNKKNFHNFTVRDIYNNNDPGTLFTLNIYYIKKKINEKL